MADEPYDAAIIGGGPAGLTAALWLGRYLHRVVVIDSGDPRNWETRGINGFPGHPEITPAELRGRTRDECRRYDVTLVDGFVASVTKEHDDHFLLDFDPIAVTKAEEDRRGPGAPRAPGDNAPRPQTERIAARRVLLAFGLRDEWPKLPGLRQVYGAYAHVCPDCDGYEVRGKRVAVIAGGRRAAGMAFDLTTWTDDVIICTNGSPREIDADDEARLEALDIPVITASITCVRVDGLEIEGLELESGEVLPCDHLFFSLSQRPADDLDAQLGCERDEHGHIVVDRRQHTSAQHVYAAGDITPGPQLAVRAASDGAVAALAIHKSLVPATRRVARR